MSHGIIHKRRQDVVDYAYYYAKESHKYQKRKYTGQPYITHPVNVAFGLRVAQFVNQLTQFSVKSDGNRKTRKELDKRYLSLASCQAKTIKIADLIDNTKSIIEYDPEFSKIYMKEKKELLLVLDGGDKHFLDIARTIVFNYFNCI